MSLQAAITAHADPLGPEPPSAYLGLWEAWRRERDPAARAELLQAHLPFARILAAKLYKHRFSDEFEFDDYLQFANIGLLESVERYDPARGASFNTFAAFRIRGAVLNGISKMSERQQQIAARRTFLEDRTGSLAEGDEPSPRGAVGDLARIAIGLAIGYMLEGTGMYAEPDSSLLESGYERVEVRQLAEQLRLMVDQLPPRERRVIREHYFQQVPFESIAVAMAVSRPRISQLHRQALQQLGKLASDLLPSGVCW
jgi:RNA polymerase sigma factor for flagellar operon FliA